MGYKHSFQKPHNSCDQKSQHKLKDLQHSAYGQDNFDFRSHNFQIFQSRADFLIEDMPVRRSRRRLSNHEAGGDLSFTGDANAPGLASPLNIDERGRAQSKKSRSSIFSWITQGNSGQAAMQKKQKQNIEFFTKFEQLFHEISGDFLSRIDELREIQSLCQIADQF